MDLIEKHHGSTLWDSDNLRQRHHNRHRNTISTKFRSRFILLSIRHTSPNPRHRTLNPHTDSLRHHPNPLWRMAPTRNPDNDPTSDTVSSPTSDPKRSRSRKDPMRLLQHIIRRNTRQMPILRSRTLRTESNA